MKKLIFLLLSILVVFIYGFGIYSFSNLLLKSRERLYLIKEQRSILYQGDNKFKIYIYTDTKTTKITKQNIKQFSLTSPNSKYNLNLELTKITKELSFLNQKRNLHKITLEFITPKLLDDSEVFTKLKITFITNEFIDLEIGKFKIAGANKFSKEDVLFTYKSFLVNSDFFNKGASYEAKFISDFISSTAVFYFSLFKENKYSVSQENQEVNVFYTNTKLTIPVLEPILIAEVELDSGKKKILQNCLSKEIRCNFKEIKDFEEIKEKGWVSIYEIWYKHCFFA